MRMAVDPHRIMEGLRTLGLPGPDQEALAAAAAEGAEAEAVKRAASDAAAFDAMLADEDEDEDENSQEKASVAKEGRGGQHDEDEEMSTQHGWSKAWSVVLKGTTKAGVARARESLHAMAVELEALGDAMAGAASPKGRTGRARADEEEEEEDDEEDPDELNRSPASI